MKKIALIGIVIFTGFAVCYLLLLSGQKEKRIQEGISQKVLRFHILANSDSEKDQELKLEVRDAIGGLMEEMLAPAKNKEESKSIIENHMEEILDEARNVIDQRGYDYEVKGEVLTMGFPEKKYGKFCFPEGEYEAFRITIGNGEGANWWCVLYPEMCFTNSIYEVNPQTEEILKRILTTEEYQEVIKDGNYKVEWKFLEYLR